MHSVRFYLTIALGAAFLLSSIFIGAIAERASHAAIQRDAFNVVKMQADSHKHELLSGLRRSRADSAASLGAIIDQCGVAKPASRDCLQIRLTQYLTFGGAVGAELQVPGLPRITAGSFPARLAAVPAGALAVFVAGAGGAYYQIEVGGETAQGKLATLFPANDVREVFEAGQSGLSGEAFLADPQGRPLTPDRHIHAPGADGAITTGPMLQCLRGQDGQVLGNDQRGIPVIMAFRFIPEIGGGCIMAHVEALDAFAPAIALRNRILLSAAVFFALGALIAVVLAGKITGPLNLLTKRISLMQSLDLSGSLPAEGPLEVRMLARAFNGLAAEVCQSDARARQSEQKFLQIADKICDVIWMTNLQGTKIEFVSRAYEQVWGRSLQSIYDHPDDWSEAVVPEDRQRVKDAFVRLGQGVEFNEEYSIVRPDGSQRRIQDHGYPVADQSGRVYRLAGIASDITALTHSRQRIEEQNQQLALRAREVQKATLLQKEFLSSVSHELRTPLNAINGFSELLLNDPELPDIKRQFAGHIHEGGKRLLLLINDIMDISKIESGQVKLLWEDFSLDSLVAEELAYFNGPAGARQISLNLVAPGEIRVCADAARLRQILHNLLSNAVKFTPQGGEIGVELGLIDGFAEIAVWDTGSGIRPEDSEVIFDRFRQVGNTMRGVREGTGLGLAITAGLVKLLGGKISLQSQPGQGSRFTLLIPRQRSSPKRRKADSVAVEAPRPKVSA